MSILDILSKKAQESLSNLSVTEILDHAIINGNQITVSDRKKLMIIKESYQDYAIESITKEETKVTSTRLCGEFFLKQLTNEPQENLVMITLNTKNNVINYHKVFKGTLNSSTAHPRDIMRLAISDNAARIVIAHNHPSGETDPSSADLKFTSRLSEVGEITGIELLDHIIVGRNTYLSLREDYSHYF